MNKVCDQPPLIDFSHFHAVLRKTDLRSCYGSVVRVSGLTIESAGPKVGLGQICGIHTAEGKRILAEVVGFRSGNLILIPLEHVENICPGDRVSARSEPRCINIDETLLGRVIDGLGRPIDGKGPLTGTHKRSLDAHSPSPMSREKITEPLATGIRAIDGILTCGKGQRIGVFAGSGVGKSVLMGELANGSQAQVNVIALIGERGREVRHFIEEDIGSEGLQRSVVIVATSDAPAIQRVKAAFVAVTIAEFFRDRGNDVLFMMDSLTRLAQAQREIGLAAGEPPATKGYTPSVFALMPRILERLGCADRGSITGFVTVLAEGDDMNDPVADSARSLLDGHLVLTRKLAQKGHYPAIDILQSISRLMALVATKEHKAAAAKLRELYATYYDAEDLINIGAYVPSSNKKIDKAVTLIDRVNAFLKQPFKTRSKFAETIGELTSIATAWDAPEPISKDKR